MPLKIKLPPPNVETLKTRLAALEKKKRMIQAVGIEKYHRLQTLEMERHRRRANSHLLDFAIYTHDGYEVNWHHDILCQYLEHWASRRIQNLMVFQPPQTGKSELVSRKLPAWLFGRNPDTHVIATSYSADLSNSMNRDVQRIIDSDRYREVFPDTRLWGSNVRTLSNQSWLRNSNEFEIVGRRGYYRCAGVGGGITGRNFHYGIIDDPYKDRAEASSSMIRKRVFEWFTSTFRTRRDNDSSGILMTLTRWNEDDLAGQLIKIMKNSPQADQWVILKLPAIKVDDDNPDDPRAIGDALWEGKFSRRYMETTRATVSSYDWSSIYQQDPKPAGGTIFSSDWFRYFHTSLNDEGKLVITLPGERDLTEDGVAKNRYRTPTREYLVSDLKFFQTIDTAMKDTESSAYTAVATCAITPGGDLIIWNVWKARLEIPYQYPAIQALRDGLIHFDHKTGKVIKLAPWPKALMFQAVESAQSGVGIIQAGMLDGRPFRILNAGPGKVERSATVSTMYMSGKVWHPYGAAWLGMAEDELTSFPNANLKDVVDVIAYAGILAQTDALLRAGVERELIIDTSGAAPPPVKVELAGGGVVSYDEDEPQR